jgi:hypothetical protein
MMSSEMRHVRIRYLPSGATRVYQTIRIVDGLIASSLQSTHAHETRFLAKGSYRALLFYYSTHGDVYKLGTCIFTIKAKVGVPVSHF